MLAKGEKERKWKFLQTIYMGLSQGDVTKPESFGFLLVAVACFMH